MSWPAFFLSYTIPADGSSGTDCATLADEEAINAVADSLGPATKASIGAECTTTDGGDVAVTVSVSDLRPAPVSSYVIESKVVPALTAAVPGARDVSFGALLPLVTPAPLPVGYVIGIRPRVVGERRCCCSPLHVAAVCRSTCLSRRPPRSLNARRV